MKTLSVIIIARDEERNIGAVLSDLKGLDAETIVVDTGSSDRTREIALASGTSVVDCEWTGDFSAARNAGLDRAKGEWIFWVDADERLAPEDAAAVRETVEKAALSRTFPSKRTAGCLLNSRTWRNEEGRPSLTV